MLTPRFPQALCVSIANPIDFACLPPSLPKELGRALDRANESRALGQCYSGQSGSGFKGTAKGLLAQVDAELESAIAEARRVDLPAEMIAKGDEGMHAIRAMRAVTAQNSFGK